MIIYKFVYMVSVIRMNIFEYVNIIKSNTQVLLSYNKYLCTKAIYNIIDRVKYWIFKEEFHLAMYAKIIKLLDLQLN